jgi:hypothetical protein
VPGLRLPSIRYLGLLTFAAYGYLTRQEKGGEGRMEGLIDNEQMLERSWKEKLSV